MQDIENILIDIREKGEMTVDSHGDVIIPTKKGDKVVLSQEVAEEVWRLLEKQHAIETIRNNIDIDRDEALLENLDFLANTYNDTKLTLLTQTEDFLVDVTLKEFDLECAYGDD